MNPSMLDLSAIRARSDRCDEYRDDPKDSIGKWALAAVASAADVPALLAEIALLTIARDNAEAVEHEAHAEIRRLRGHLADANRTIQALVTP
jgi:hypothetical protein